MFEKVYELPLSKGYVKHWGVVEAVRELLQNALDSDSPLEYNLNQDYLQITSRNARLEPKTLLLGTTSKAEASDKIGQFGEGYKIALLVLTRAGYPVQVLNNDLMWTPGFIYNRLFEDELLCITETKLPTNKGKGVSFCINNLTPQDIEAIRNSCLLMQESIGQVIHTSYGLILKDKPGMLYVKGLFVCETEMKFGYDIKPEHLKLERDRRTVTSFDLAWITKQMWFETGRNDEIAELMEADSPDLQYAQYNTPEIVREACYQHFIQKNPKAVIAENKADLDKLVSSGMTVYVGGYSSSNSYLKTVSDSRSYKSEVAVVHKTPEQELAEWYSANRSFMRTPAIVSFKALLTAAKTWRLK